MDLLIELYAHPKTVDRQIISASARQGTATLDLSQPGTDLRPLFDTIMKYIPAPEGDPEGPAQVLISTIDYSEYVGRIGIGRITRGTLKDNMMVVRCNAENDQVSAPWRLTGLSLYDGLKRVGAETVSMGDIVALTGLAGFPSAIRCATPPLPNPCPS